MTRQHHQFISSADHDLDSASPQSTSQSQPQRNPNPAGESVTDFSLDAPPKNLRDSLQLSQESDSGASLRIDDRVGEQSECSERVRVELEAETCKESNSNEFDVTDRFSELGLGVEEPELSE